MSETHTYTYRGPVYDYWEKYVEDVFEATTAVSKMKAACNIEHKLNQDPHRSKKVHIDRDPKYWEIK